MVVNNIKILTVSACVVRWGGGGGMEILTIIGGSHCTGPCLGLFS